MFWPKIVIVKLSSFFHLPQTANSYLSSFSRYLSSKSGSQIFLSVSTLLVYISNHQFSFHTKVAMGFQLNNSWSIGQIPMMLYIFGILWALGVHLYQFWDNTVWSMASRGQRPRVGKNKLKHIGKKCTTLRLNISKTTNAVESRIRYSKNLTFPLQITC